MVTLRLPLLGALALLLAAPASLAQPRFHLVEPTLRVGSRTYEVVGAPLEQPSFGYVVLTVPGQGRYVVSDRPFEGARRAGQFDGATLAFAVEGQSVRLHAAEPILASQAPAYAFVRHAPSADARADGPAVVSLRLPDVDPADAEASGPVPPSSGRPAGLGTETEALVARRQEQARMEAEVARAREERDRLNAEVAALEGELARVEREAQPLAEERATLRGRLDRLQAERTTADRARRSLDFRRAALAADHAALQRDLDAYSEQARRFEAERARLTAERDRHAAGLDGTRRERAALEADLQALESQRAALLAERDRLDHERLRLDAETQALGRSVGTLGAETARLTGERDRLADEHARLVAQRDSLASQQQRLAREVGALRRATNALSGETERLARERDQLRSPRTPPSAASPVEPPADQRNRTPQPDALQVERDQLRQEADGLRRELTRLQAEVERLRQERTRETTGDGAEALDRLRHRAEAAESERDEVAVTNAELRREKAALEERVQALETERGQLLQARDRLERERVQLQEERDALHREAESLRSQLEQETPPPAWSGDARPAPPPAEHETDGPAVTLPGFDWSRLQNADEVGAMLREAPYPREALLARTGGDALVLFATDDTGRVTEATVAEPLGYGLDALAEVLVSSMRFVPPSVNGQPTGLRSQVVVRFEQ